MTAPPRAPQRVQRKRTKGWRMPPDSVYVGRPSRWGNPWLVNSDLGRGLLWDAALVRDLYRADITTRWFDPERLAAFLAPLRGKTLVCWCPLCDLHTDGRPADVPCPDCPPCHADVCLELAR